MNFFQLILVFLNVTLLSGVVKGGLLDGILSGLLGSLLSGPADHPEDLPNTSNNNCISSGSPCSARQQCCPISNGKSYCNVQSGRCEAILYCDETSTEKCPFDDLSADELAQTVKIIKESKSFSSQIVFPFIRKQEPKKKDWNSGAKSARERVAYATVLDVRRRNVLSEVLISLTNQRIISKKDSPKMVALITAYECHYGEEILRKDPRVTKAYERRGLNASYAAFDLWANGANGDVDGKLRIRALLNYKDPTTRSKNWRPLEGLEATIDLTEGKIINFIDEGIVPVPKPAQLSNSVVDPPAPDDAPPTDSAIKVNGYVVNWKNWKFQYSIDPVHGLQLYHIRHTADCEERFMIYKLSLSEMFVPYGQKGKTWRWRGAFDAGEYGLGKSVSPLTLGIDVPKNAKLLSCPAVNDITGEVTEVKSCIALYERGAGSWYKHRDTDSGTEDSKAAGDMVATFMCNIGNYDYMFEYVFKIDGTIDVGVYATGILLTRAVPQVRNDPNCIEDCQDFINENAIAPPHQHFFSYRIDFDIEGTNNMLTEVDLVNEPVSSSNPDGGAFKFRRTIIRKETYRDHSPARLWSVINPQSRNKYNTPRGLALHPTSLGHMFLKPGDPLNQAMFVAHPIWVTKYKDEEQGAADDFPRSGISGQGLPQYIKNQEPLENADLVLWHTFAITHPPRPEEYPFMNAVRVGFVIMPRNFAASNPMVALENQCPSKASMLNFM